MHKWSKLTLHPRYVRYEKFVNVNPDDMQMLNPSAGRKRRLNLHIPTITCLLITKPADKLL
jgi:hypothetical protein